MITKYKNVFSFYNIKSSTLTQEPQTYKILILDEAIFLIIILYLEHELNTKDQKKGFNDIFTFYSFDPVISPESNKT